MMQTPKRAHSPTQCAICGAPSVMIAGVSDTMHPVGRCALHRFVDAQEVDEVIASCGPVVTLPARVTFTDSSDEDTQPGEACIPALWRLDEIDGGDDD